MHRSWSTWLLTANLEGYELQPKKSVAIHIRGNNKRCETTNEKLNMGNITMPEVEQATHLGIIRTATMKHNIQTNVDENITKPRRSAYSLFGCGFHGHNGLDPVSLLHIYKTYITPVLLYGMELLLPSSKPLEQLELFQKRILKQILSLPMSCPDPVGKKYRIFVLLLEVVTLTFVLQTSLSIGFLLSPSGTCVPSFI
jgi:hypothetical protein